LRPRDIALALLVVVLWGVNFVVIKVALRGVSEKPDRAQLAGMAVAAAGLCWIGAASGSSFPLAAFALNLCASACWAAGNLVSRSLSRQGPVNGLAFVVWASLIPPLPFFALAFCFEGSGAIASSLRAMDAISWLAVAYLAVGATIGGYGLWNRLLKSYPAAQVAPFTLLVPVVGLIAGTVALGERLTGAQLAGSALVATGLAVPVASARWKRRS